MLSDEPVAKQSPVHVLRGLAAPGLRRWIECLCVLAVCLGLVPGAQAQARDSVQDAEARSQAGMEALVAGLLAMRRHNLALAEKMFKRALATDDSGDLRDTATEELTYRLPLKRVERYVASNQWGKAEQLLQDLREQHRSDERKSRHLAHLLEKVRDRTLVPEDTRKRSVEGRGVVAEVEQTLEQFLEENGRYPRGYDELNEILPAGRYPLDEHDIVHYVGRDRAYGLTLRSRTNPDNLVTVQRTGLLQ